MTCTLLTIIINSHKNFLSKTNIEQIYSKQHHVKFPQSRGYAFIKCKFTNLKKKKAQPKNYFTIET